MVGNHVGATRLERPEKGPVHLRAVHAHEAQVVIVEHDGNEVDASVGEWRRHQRRSLRTRCKRDAARGEVRGDDHARRRGRNGGHNGAAGILSLGSGQKLRGMGVQTVPKDDRVIIRMPGGGDVELPPGMRRRRVYPPTQMAIFETVLV